MVTVFFAYSCYAVFLGSNSEESDSTLNQNQGDESPLNSESEELDSTLNQNQEDESPLNKENTGEDKKDELSAGITAGITESNESKASLGLIRPTRPQPQEEPETGFQNSSQNSSLVSNQGKDEKEQIALVPHPAHYKCQIPSTLPNRYEQKVSELLGKVRALSFSTRFESWFRLYKSFASSPDVKAKVAKSVLESVRPLPLKKPRTSLSSEAKYIHFDAYSISQLVSEGYPLVFILLSPGYFEAQIEQRLESLTFALLSIEEVTVRYLKQKFAQKIEAGFLEIQHSLPGQLEVAQKRDLYCRLLAWDILVVAVQGGICTKDYIFTIESRLNSRICFKSKELRLLYVETLSSYPSWKFRQFFRTFSIFSVWYALKHCINGYLWRSYPFYLKGQNFRENCVMLSETNEYNPFISKEVQQTIRAHVAKNLPGRAF